MELITILLILSFLKYAKHTEVININEWLTLINTKRNRILILVIIILFYLTPIGQAIIVILASLTEGAATNLLLN